MGKQRDKTPKTKFNPDKVPRAGYEPNKSVRLKTSPLEQDDTDRANPAWKFHKWDKDHHLWGWNKLENISIIGILSHLADFEGMTWQQIKQQAGGRRHGTNSHSLKLDGFSKDAKDRLKELKLDDQDVLFSLRLTNTTRLYGIRQGRTLSLLWHDPYHGGDNAAYPTAS